MKLFYGSVKEIKEPSLAFSRTKIDFGIGVYLTTNVDQAIAFANIVSNRTKMPPIINVYVVNNSDLNKLKILKFISPNNKWLDYVLLNRSGKEENQIYDLAIGPVANDKVYRTISQLENGEITRNQALEFFKINDLYIQYVFKTNKPLSFLKFEESFMEYLNE